MQLPVENRCRDQLIVIIPECLAGNRELAHKIFWLATHCQSEVYYLTLVDNEEAMLSTNFAMITMKAITASNSLTVHYQLTKTALWKRTLLEIYQRGDRVVCLQEQQVRTGLFTRIQISEYLYDVLGITTVTISGFYHPEKEQARHWFHSVITWSGFLMILFCFLALEILMDGQVNGILKKVILSISFTLELATIWAWNSIVG